jgi:steroid delta-isomerase-like uncharacterized protein
MKKLLTLMCIAGIVASCNMPNNMANDKGAKNEARFQQFYDQVFNAHNPALVDSFCTADFVDHSPSPGHSGKGLDDLKAEFKDYTTAFPDVKIQTQYMISKGDTLFAKVTMTGTNTGPMMPGMPPTNKPFNIEGVDVIVMKDGKATDRWGYFENEKMMQQLGMMPDMNKTMDQAMDQKK